MIREKIYEHCSIHWFSKRSIGDVFYIIKRNKEDRGFMRKKGEVNSIHVWLSSDDNTIFDDSFFGIYWKEEDIEGLSLIEATNPILVGELCGRDFYFRPELMNGTPTDETQPTDFIEVLMDFKEIARNVNGRPFWDEEVINFERIDGKKEFKYTT